MLNWGVRLTCQGLSMTKGSILVLHTSRLHKFSLLGVDFFGTKGFRKCEPYNLDTTKTQQKPQKQHKTNTTEKCTEQNKVTAHMRKAQRIKKLNYFNKKSFYRNIHTDNMYLINWCNRQKYGRCVKSLIFSWKLMELQLLYFCHCFV